MSSINLGMTNLQSTLAQAGGQAQTSQLESLQKQFAHPTSADSKKLKKAAQEFESIFVQQMLDMMDKTIDRQNSLLSGGNAEDYWRGMMNQEVAKSMCERPMGSGFGLAESIYKQMAQNMAQGQETTPNPPASSEKSISTNQALDGLGSLKAYGSANKPSPPGKTSEVSGNAD